MIYEEELKKKDKIRKKYYLLEKRLYFISFRKLIRSLGITWSAWYRFIYYGENTVSLKTLEVMEEKLKSELKKSKTRD